MENSDAFNTAPILLSKINDLGKQIEDIECVNIVNSTITNKIETNIDGIKKDIHDIDFRNRVDACIRNVKIFGRFMQLLCPYILVLSVRSMEKYNYAKTIYYKLLQLSIS